MKMCQKHWDALRQALAAHGLDRFGARDAQQAVIAATNELEGRGAENEFDPLMSCNWMIFNKALKTMGLGLLGAKEDGEEYCPICESVKAFENWWIDGPANEMLREAQQRGLLPMQGKRVDYPGPDTLEHHQPGNYWKDDKGEWYGVAPNGFLCWLKNHHVEEHEDGTISVVSGTCGSNSILVTNGTGNQSWHGYIVRGVWEGA